MIITLLKLTFYGIVEGITEWLPISSTGHLILLDKYLNLPLNTAVKEFFLVFIQFGAVMAVITTYFKNLNPFFIDKTLKINKNKINLWLKIAIACIPVSIIGLFFDDIINKKFYNIKTVSLSLIIVGIIFLFVEKANKNNIKNNELSTRCAFIIGIIQTFSAIFPGVSRSGSTIIGANLLGYSKESATEFSFYMAIPIMFGASLLKFVKLIKKGIILTMQEIFIILYSALIAYIVSFFIIKFLIKFVKKHSFKLFGFYRIFLGFLILLLN